MEFNSIERMYDDNFDDSVNLRDSLEKYLIHFKWFVLSVIILGVLAFLKLRYETPKYNVSASILIKDKDKGNSFTNLSAFEDLGLFGSGDNSLENEIQVLKSRKLMTKVVEELNLNIRYFIEDSPYDKELYPNFPIVLNIKSDSNSIKNFSTKFEILISSPNKFEFFSHDEISIGVKLFGEDFEADLGSENLSNLQTLSIDLNEDYKVSLINKRIKVFISPVTSVANAYMNKIIIEPVNEKFSRVLLLSTNETVKGKGIAVINNLIEQYNADGVYDKNQIAQTTTNFLDERLNLISTELGAIETTAAQFKTNKGMIDVGTGSDVYLQSSSKTESELIAANTQMQLVEYMLGELKKNSLGDLLPSNIGLSDPSIVNMISDYNNLVLQRNRILKSSSTKNPIIVNIDSQLVVLKNNLLSSLNTLKSSFQIQINALIGKRGRISSKIASVPKFEKEYKDIVRKQETKNALYLFLLQKREESILSNAVNIEKAKIVDAAYVDKSPVSPKKKIVYLLSFVIGMLIPAGIIYLKDSLDTKVHDEDDIKMLRLPYLGDVPYTTSKKDLYISDIDNSNVAESFRYLRTNINFMLDSKEYGKTVFVTSTQSHEGKTFTAINLALSLAISGKKTLLLGMDLRAPKITKYLDLNDLPGVSNFIKDDTLPVEDIIGDHTKLDKLDLINSGDIPPNPVELLMSKRVTELFDYAKNNYEYIIVDNAPVGMVTDIIQISRFADLTIYVIKANYLDKRMLHIPDKLSKENKLPNMAILINGSDHSKGAYGYGYGYGYGNEKEKPWYKKIFKSTAIQ